MQAFRHLSVYLMLSCPVGLDGCNCWFMQTKGKFNLDNYTLGFTFIVESLCNTGFTNLGMNII